MYQRIGNVSLKNGESAELGMVLGPETGDLGIALRGLLGHKGKLWQWQIEQSLTKSHPGVESRFYILSKSGKPFANIMCVERQGIGIFGHVYTAPEERRKGAADILHGCQIEDFKTRGGRALYLGTEFDSHPYHLYARHGFLGVEPSSGYMFWFAKCQENFEREIFQPSKVRHEPLHFAHWPTLPALAMMKHPARIRIAGMDVINVRSTEGGSLQYLSAMDTEERSARAWVAVSEASGIPVALACSKPHGTFAEQSDLVDLFCAPGFESELPALFAKLELDTHRTALCYADLTWPQRSVAMKACGFVRHGQLPKLLRSRGEAHDIEVWVREPR